MTYESPPLTDSAPHPPDSSPDLSQTPSEPDAHRPPPKTSEHGAPSVGAAIEDRFDTVEVFKRVIVAADEEINTRARELFFSGLAAGFSVTLTVLLYASMMAATGNDPLLGAVLYPIGFIYIILGGYNLYTEDTLPPVALVLERLASLPALFRVWGVVLAGNFIGGGCGALLLATTNVLSPEAATAATEISMKGLQTPFGDLFFKALVAGFVVAGVVWLNFTARSVTGRFLLTYVAFLCIPYGNLYHVVVSFTELTFLTIGGHAAFVPGFLGFVLPVVLGNTAGGVILVTVVNYFQTTERRLIAARGGTERELSMPEVFFGGLVGRSYVPVRQVDHAD